MWPFNKKPKRLFVDVQQVPRGATVILRPREPTSDAHIKSLCDFCSRLNKERPGIRFVYLEDDSTEMLVIGVPE